MPQLYLLNLIHKSRHGSLRNESKEDDLPPVVCGTAEHNSRVCNIRGRQSVAYAPPAGTKALHGLRTCPTGTQHAIRYRYWCHRDRLPGLGAKEDETDVAKTHRQSGPLDAVPGYLSRSHSGNFRTDFRVDQNGNATSRPIVADGSSKASLNRLRKFPSPGA